MQDREYGIFFQMKHRLIELIPFIQWDTNGLSESASTGFGRVEINLPKITSASQFGQCAGGFGNGEYCALIFYILMI